jgi:hypothetical protein
MVHTHARRKRSEAEELARRANAKFSGNAGKLSDTNYEVLGQLLGSSEDEIAATVRALQPRVCEHGLAHERC